jgi:hypothetical protein
MRAICSSLLCESERHSAIVQIAMMTMTQKE